MQKDKRLTERFNMLFLPEEKQALQRLADRKGVSQGDLIRGMVRRMAKRHELL